MLMLAYKEGGSKNRQNPAYVICERSLTKLLLKYDTYKF